MFLLRRCAVICAAVGLSLVGAAAPASAAPQLNSQDRAYLMGAHQSNLAEITTGRLAQRKGSTERIRELGAMLVADHTKLDANLRKVAAAADVTLPNAPNAEQRALAAKLAAADGAEFDAQFVSGQLAAHAKAMALGKNELARGSDRAVKADARAAAPVIAKHHRVFSEQARSMELPSHVHAGLSGAAAGSENTVPTALIGLGAVLVAAGGVLAIRRRTAA